jgi:hypothetical protein
MNRKTIVAGIIILLLSLVIVYSIDYLKKYSGGKQDALDAVPLDAMIVLKSASAHGIFNPLMDDNNIYLQLQKLPALQTFDQIITTIDSLSVENKELKNIIQNKQFSLSMHPVGKDRVGFIYYVNLENRISRNKIESMVKKHVGGELQLSERKYEGFTITDMQLDSAGNFSNWSLSLFQDLLIISRSSILLENALRQVKQDEKIYNSKQFKSIQQTLGKNVNGNVFVNYENLPKLINSISKNKNTVLHSAVQDFSSWAGLDLHIKKNAFMLSGFSTLKDSLNTFINLFSDQSPQQIEMFRVLPASTNTFLLMGVDNFPEYSLKYEDHLNFLGKFRKRKAYKDKVQKEYDFSFYEHFEKYIGNEFGFAVSEFSSIESTEDFPFVVIETRSGEKIKQSIERLVKSAALDEGRSLAALRKTIHLDEKTILDVYELPVQNFSYQLLGHFFDFPKNNYATVIDNYLVLGISPEVLSKFAHLKILGKTLESNPVFHNFSSLMSDVTNYFFYTNIPKSVNVYNKLLKDEIVSGIKKNNAVFQKVQAFGIQYNVTGKRMFTNAFLQYNQQFNEPAHTVWETLLDTAMNFKPVFVENHYTKENEIFVQDLHNNIYLINKVGRVLWKATLSEQINSEIFQVDYYRNGKLQYIFSTPSQLHLIDRNGNYVERYPVSLRSKASAGMSLFDYDNNYNYRIFIPTQNKRVYLYDLKGDIVEGWTFSGAEHVVKQPVKHFRVDNKDYIVFSDGITLYILNRRGQVRVPVDELITKSENNTIYLNAQSANAFLVTTSVTGEVYKIFFNGRVEKHQMAEYTSKHYFDFEDVDADGVKDYIFLDEKVLSVYNQSGKKLLNRKFNYDVTHPPVYFHFSYSDRKIGVTCADANKIYLINNDGNLYNGFPLKGNTLFSIGKLTNTSRFNLIVGNVDNFLLNYSVQ